MESFFQLGSSFDEIEVKELLLRRYANIDYLLSMPVDEFLRFIQLAEEKEREERIHAQWVALLPYMSLEQLKYMSFEQYMDKCTGRNIDMRPASVIIAEIEEAHRKARGE